MTAVTKAKHTEDLELFLKSYKVGTRIKYRDVISRLSSNGTRSIVVDFEDIFNYRDTLANLLILEPDTILESFNRAAYETLRIVNTNYANKIRKDLKIRIRGLPERLSLRNLSTDNLDRLIAVPGLIVRTSELKPLAIEAAFKCRRDHITMVIQNDYLLKKPTTCDDPGCDENKFFDFSQKETVFVDYQIIRLQELPEELPPGQLPQAFDVDLTGDMVNVARPGDRVELTGIIRADPEYLSSIGRLRTFKSRIEGLYVEVLGKEAEQSPLSPEDIEKIKQIASEENAYKTLIESIAPAIHGFETQKEAILLLAVGSPRRSLPDGSSVRGDINVLLVGDPGTAKSELLKYAARVAPRGLYTSGRGSTAAGLTAAVVREKSGTLMLEAGAVVLADQGVAAIDEFDKMRPEDRSALHETMEQQTVSVAKGGIVATLNARTSILAAANPTFGKYDSFRNLTENLNIPIPLLTRFDLIFALKDIPNREDDERLARHILALHRKGDFVRQPAIGFEMLRNYLNYVKNIQPILTKEAEDKILEYYLYTRTLGGENMITVTARQLESLIRLATSRSRILMKEKVTEEEKYYCQ